MKTWLVVPMVGLALACGSAPRGEARNGGDPNVITMEAIARTGSIDAYDAVQALKPNWLLTRGAGSLRRDEVIQVYLDGNRMGGIAFLRQIAANTIHSIRHLDGLEAAQRYGLDHGQGAILVTTQNR